MIHEREIESIVANVLQNIERQLKASEPKQQNSKQLANNTQNRTQKTSQFIHAPGVVNPATLVVHGSGNSAKQRAINTEVVTDTMKPDGHLGVFSKMEEAIAAASHAFEKLSMCTIDEREQMIEAIRQISRDEAENMSVMGFEETNMGNVPDKIIKHLSVANLTPGTEDLAQPETYTGASGMTVIEHTAYGVVGAITPSTNSSETIICNTIGMLAAGNVVVFNAHPGAKKTSIYTVRKLNEAARRAGAPSDVIFTIANPTIASSQVLFQHPDVKLLVGTGGPALSEAILKAGKKAICAGAGNPPVIVDETADLARAAKQIVAGATLDNNMPCISEKECFVMDEVADDLLYHFMQNNVYIASKQEVEKLYCQVFTTVEEKKSAGCAINNKGTAVDDLAVNKQWIGQDAVKLLESIGVYNQSNVKLIVCEVEAKHPFVMKELMMPILPVVRVKTFDEAVQYAVDAEGGNKHSAYIHSNHLARITSFARRIQTTIFVANGPSFASIGIEGEGFCSFTIAGVTGEGITSPRSFARKRRLVLSSGELNLK